MSTAILAAMLRCFFKKPQKKAVTGLREMHLVREQQELKRLSAEAAKLQREKLEVRWRREVEDETGRVSRRSWIRGSNWGGNDGWRPPARWIREVSAEGYAYEV